MVNFKSESIPEDHDIFGHAPGLSMGQRIMNHKFAKMSIWEYLGWRPKAATDPEMTFEEFEKERWKKKEEMDQQMLKRENARVRTFQEWNKIAAYRNVCRNVMFLLSNEFRDNPEWDDQWRMWFLSETAAAFLPICFGEILKKMKADGKYLPCTHMVLI